MLGTWDCLQSVDEVDADALSVTPAAVSQQIKALEGYIQVPLFRRNGRRVEITEEGLELLPAVRASSTRMVLSGQVPVCRKA